jgi:hypothetical protein
MKSELCVFVCVCSCMCLCLCVCVCVCCTLDVRACEHDLVELL